MNRIDALRSPGESELPEVQELPLLLPSWQAAALESAASAQGISAGQMVRRLISEFFQRREQPQPDASWNAPAGW